jgi:hypothetical protein
LQFDQWLLSVSEGRDQSEFIDEFELKFGFIYWESSLDILMDRLIKFVYEDLPTGSSRDVALNPGAYYKARAIITPLNKHVKLINNWCLALVLGKMFFSISVDQMTDLTGRAVPEEILNTINILNFPEHRLSLKIGMPIILLQNLCLKDGLANGTKIIVRDIQPKILQAEIINGPHSGTVHMRPRLC